jgi:hypothetical protein
VERKARGKSADAGADATVGSRVTLFLLETLPHTNCALRVPRSYKTNKEEIEVINASDVIVVSPGQALENPLGRKPVAITKVSIQIPDPDNLKKCVAMLQASDIALSLKPDSAYVWEMVTVVNDTVHFGVAWYDEQFFLEKKQVYTDVNHFRMFEQFGVTPADFNVQHFAHVS